MPWTAKHLASSWYAPSLMSYPFCCIAYMETCVYQSAANCVTHIDVMNIFHIVQPHCLTKFRGTCSPLNTAEGCGPLY